MNNFKERVTNKLKIFNDQNLEIVLVDYNRTVKV